jgi:hypothetical protein
VLAPVGAGCGDVYADLCDRGARCRGASDRDVEACIIDLEAKGEVAEIWGCDAQWDAYIDCLDRRGACMGDRLTGCDDEKERWRRCVP